MSRRTDTTTSSLMNIAFLPLHRLNTRILCLFASTDRSLCFLSLSFSHRRKRNGPIILSLSLSLDRQSEEKKSEKKGERKAFIISGDTKEPFVHLLDRRFSPSFSRYIFIIISMRDESRAQHISSSPIVNYRPDV